MTTRFLIMVAAGAWAASSIGTVTAGQVDTKGKTDWRQGMRATHALNLLEEHGDGQFFSFAASGKNFSADVMKQGKVVHVIVDPDTGQIQATDSANANLSELNWFD